VRRPFDWLAAIGWLALLAFCLVFFVGVVAVVEWLA
jgi:hypothetical protein